MAASRDNLVRQTMRLMFTLQPEAAANARSHLREWSLAETSATVALAAANLAFISAEENT
jgi:hypothetical protein